MCCAWFFSEMRKFFTVFKIIAVEWRKQKSNQGKRDKGGDNKQFNKNAGLGSFGLPTHTHITQISITSLTEPLRKLLRVLGSK